jgi:hypothetical protein
LFNEPDIVKYIKINRLGWAGHVIRMYNNRTVKKVFNSKPIRIRKIGRPKLRWEMMRSKILRIGGTQQWKRRAFRSF